MVGAALLALAPAVLFAAAAAAQQTARCAAAHVARSAALLAALAVAWLVAVDAPVAPPPYRWLDVGSLQFDVGLRVDGQAAALLVLLSLWMVLAPFLSGTSSGKSFGKTEPGSGGALDLGATGVALVVTAAGNVLALAGCEILLAACFLHAIGAPVTMVAARRLLFLTRFGGLALVASLIFVQTPAQPWLVLLTAAVLVGVWPFHPWFEDLGQGGTGTGFRLLAMLTGVSLCLRFAGGVSQTALVLLAVSCLLSIGAALATQDLFRAQIFTIAAQAGVVLAAALLQPLAALLLTSVYGASQVVHATSLNRITSALDSSSPQLADLGGLRAALPWSRWLALCGALTAAISLPALWAVALLANQGWDTAGPAGAAIVALLCALPCLPLARVTLVPFHGPGLESGPKSEPESGPKSGPKSGCHTPTNAAESQAPHRAALVSVLVVAGPVVGLTWLVAPLPPMPAAIAAAASVLMASLTGFFLWRRGPRVAHSIQSPLREAASSGFGISSLLTGCATGIVAFCRLVWTALDGVLFAGVPGLLNLSVRASGWLLARLHDGWSGWAVATGIGTVVILLWSMRLGGSW